MTTVAIIGAGPLGRWLALAAARAGFHVFLEDVMPSNLHHAQEYIRQQLSPGQQEAVLQGHAFRGENAEESLVASAAEASRQRVPAGFPSSLPVQFVSTVEDAVREADLAIDCVPDELESKLEILWLLDRMAPPRTVIATPTTNLSIVDLANCTYRPEKCIAIAASPRTLSDQRPGSTIHLQITARTTPETAALVESFWGRLGFLAVIQQTAD